MIGTIQEYLRLADSDNVEEAAKTKTEELSSVVIFEILHRYPERKAWLVHNKHIPVEILREHPYRCEQPVIMPVGCLPLPW